MWLIIQQKCITIYYLTTNLLKFFLEMLQVNKSDEKTFPGITICMYKYGKDRALMFYRD